MYTTEIKVMALKKKVLIGDALKGAMQIMKLSKIANFPLNISKLAKYLLEVNKIQSFEDIDLLYNDMFNIFCPEKNLVNTRIISFVNKKVSDLIDISLSNYTLSFNFLLYIYEEFISEFVYEFISNKVSKNDTFEVIIDIPTININSIYCNYENLDYYEKIDKFKEELTIWSMYNHIATLTQEDFEIVELEDEDVLMIQFNIINKVSFI